VRAVSLALAAAAGCLWAAASCSARAPVVDQMVVFRSGKAVERRVSAAGVRVRVGRRRCAVPAGTALATLVRARPGRIRLRDYGSCSSRPRDAGGLYVKAIGPDRARGQMGWVYKVGRKAATAGAADPSGPFGRGRLRGGRRVVWFYCRRATNCQRTLEARPRVKPGAVVVKVLGFDDAGRGVSVAGATVHVGSATATTGADGRARVAVGGGRHRVYADKRGLVRSFPERVTVGG
jgi:hypothetical protein